MIASAAGAWAAAWPARTARSRTGASAASRGVMISCLEEVLEEHEDAIVAPVAPPGAVRLARREEVEAAFHLERVGDPMRELGLHVGVGRAVEVEDGRELHLGVLAHLDQRAADQRLAEDGARDQTA